MTPAVVVDVGNTRIKWGRCARGEPLPTALAALPPDDPVAWQEQADRWQVPAASTWVIAGVHPARQTLLADWLTRRGATVRRLERPEELPLRVLLDEPAKVGIDRLLNAVAVNRLRPLDTSAIIVGAGTALTVDLVDEAGAFRGGAILPGFRLMAQALHQQTALLPLVDLHDLNLLVETPGRSTTAAIRAGVFWAAVGGVRALIDQYGRNVSTPPAVYVTGGDGERVWAAVGGVLVPALTLQGIRLTAETLT